VKRVRTLAATAWPDRLTIEIADLTADPSSWRPAIHAARAGAQRLTLTGQVAFGDDPMRDVVVLRLLSEAAAQLVDLDWTLAAEPPWPLRTVVHLPPPAATNDFAHRWRAEYRVGLCVYRVGPGFVRIRDLRPHGPHLRVLIDGEWATGFAALAGDPWHWPDERASTLVDDLTENGLALPLPTGPHLLPTRVLRWPIPQSDI